MNLTEKQWAALSAIATAIAVALGAKGHVDSTAATATISSCSDQVRDIVLLCAEWKQPDATPKAP